ncbi:T9SS type A sorting domain-containing protein [Aquiflexum sp. LQ15W]|uniref:T9SS type A sorting domain-containing protein n=1 Tax=Cognataquiflexum nitidum TaxID=2922272 RepID=UPI001F13CD76|nr:T9SS type A sorting domain-containing protein [Cognataquiflexum nitidum]MCH6200418.1 T9SS type A sorting domain-containing protein [Cognataquiflexum nitidum]
MTKPYYMIKKRPWIKVKILFLFSIISLFSSPTFGGETEILSILNLRLADPVQVYSDATETTLLSSHVTIQAGINAAAAGNVVRVDAGTYTENVLVDKSIFIRGANFGVNPNTGTRVAESILSGTFSLRSSGINIDGFKVTGTGAAFAAGGAGPWSDVILTNNIAEGNTGQQTIVYGFASGAVTTSIGAQNWVVSNNLISDIQLADATAIALFNITGLTISNNTILHSNASFNGRRGMNIDGSRDVVISGNTVNLGIVGPLSDNTDGTFTKARYSLQLSASDRSVSNVSVTGNIFGGAYDGIITLGNGEFSTINILSNEISDVVIGVRTQAGSNTNVGSHSNFTISNNKISSSNRSIFLQSGGVGTLDPYNAINITENSLLRSSVGAALEIDAIAIITDGKIAASGNWYGSAEYAVVSGRVAGAIDFIPFLTDGTDTDPLVLGLQPVANANNGTAPVQVYSDATETTLLSGHGTIQAGINAAAAGNVVRVDAGIYTENLTINKRITLKGAGSASTTIQAATASMPVITVTGSGLDASNRLVISGLKITGATGSGNPGSGILVVDPANLAAQGYMTFSGLDITGNGGEGLVFNNTIGVTDIIVLNSSLSSNSGSGLRIASAVPTFDGLNVSGCTIANNGGSGFNFNPSASQRVGTNFSFTNTNFNTNNTIGTNNVHDISMLGFNGSVSFTDVNVNSSNPNYAMVFGGFTNSSNPVSPAGAIVLNGVNVTGTVGKEGVLFFRYSEASAVSLTDLDVKDLTAGWVVQINCQHTTGILNLGNTSLKTLSAGSTGTVNATEASFFNSSNVLLDKGILADNFQIADQFLDKIDLATRGYIEIVAGKSFVTTNSFFTPNTSPSIQRAIDALPTGGTVHIQGGANYTGGADATTSGKNVTLSPGSSPACVTVDGNLTLDSGDVLEIEVSGVTACTEYDQFKVNNGTVTLGGSSLSLDLSYTPGSGDQITIIDGSSAIVGMFAEGTSIMVGGLLFSIDYAGGPDGFDVVLTAPEIEYDIDASESSIPVPVGQAAILKATISPNSPGVNVTFTVTNEANVTVYTATVITDDSGFATATTDILGTIGVFKVTATVNDGNNSSTAYIPVYDASGSFVTGGGWINSPAGSMPANPTVIGKANFGFVSRYKKGSSQVDGNTDFQFVSGNLIFKSNMHESGSLVISGRRATYRGTGTINGQSGFKFVVVAIDGNWNGQTNPDAFRIKISTTSGEVIYDNRMGSAENTEDATILGNNGTGGGSIVIHEAKGKGNKRIEPGSTEDEMNSTFENNEKELVPNTIRIYPNPASEVSNIQVNLYEGSGVTLRVFDVAGRLVMEEQSYQERSFTRTLELKGLSNGLYHVVVQVGNQVMTKRLVKK